MGFVRLACAACLLPLAAMAQHAAEIVNIKGRGDFSRAPTSGWAPARPQQKLEAGIYLRTLQDSRISLLMVDETQATIDSNSLVQVKAPAGEPRKSLMDFQKGKGRFETKTPAKSFAVTTPTGLAAIRGTEWLVEVADDGNSSFTVVEGEIELSNDLGSLAVASGEQGFLERGKPPFKRSVQSPRERVQWVTQFEVDPTRYRDTPGDVAELLRRGEIEPARQALAGRDDSPIAHFLLADIALYRGNPREAIDWLSRAASRFPAEPRTQGLLARAYLVADDLPRAREAAAAALARHPDTLESQLYAAEVARLDGDAQAALRALRQATRIAPADWRAWHALGVVHAERADPRRGRRALARAHELSPGNATVLGERGLLEANAYDLALARETLAAALAAQPADFATWTGLGFARLKLGDVDGALEALRKATLLEPRYARAHVYLAVAYWQQGRASDALAELRTASVHDPRDPLPYQLASIIHSDLMRPADAAAAAREAMARLQYVKSLDAVANDLRGAANLGTPLAQFGLEAWAFKNAQDSYDPLWAGSHFFLADNLTGRFALNSELMQGFLSDPLAFGSSNRFQPLVQGQGHYAMAVMRGSRSGDLTNTEPLVNANGLTLDGRLAYFAEGLLLKAYPRDHSTDDRFASGTLALGLRPRDDLGIFLYGNRVLADSRTGVPGRSLLSPHRVIEGPLERFDGGLMYRPGPGTRVWLKAGIGSERTTIASHDVVRAGTFEGFSDSFFHTAPRRRDWQARALHRLPAGMEISAAAERATFRSVDFFERDAFVRVTTAGTRLLESVRQDIRDVSENAELAVRTPPHRALVAELQLDYSRYQKTNDIVVRRDFAGQLVELEDDFDRSQASPRAGVVWKPWAQLTLRGAYQRWLRPASIGSLRSPSTAGITLDERYVLPGGKFQRLRGQVEWQLGNVLVTAFGDRQEIDNLYSSLAGVLNRPDPTNLDRLRNRGFNAFATLNDLDGFPFLAKGDLTESGIGVNAIATRHLAVFAEGRWASSEITGGPHAGNRFAYMPRRRLMVGATFFSDHRWSLAAKAVHRGDQFVDEANTAMLPRGWNGIVQAYWESAAKRWAVELTVSQIGLKGADEAFHAAVSYRF